MARRSRFLASRAGAVAVAAAAVGAGCQTPKARAPAARQAPVPGVASAVGADLGLGGEAPAAPVPADPTLATLPFPAMPVGGAGRDAIRVRVFPPRGGRGDAITLRGSCEARRGRKDQAEGRGKALGRRDVWTLAAKSLKAPLWLACTGATVVERGGAGGAPRYEGDFYVRARDADEGGGVEVINVVPVEAYLRGVVPVEVSPSWPAETLKAQAIAARTYAYYNVAHNMRAPEPRLHDVDDTSFYQAYGGLGVASTATDAAIAATEGVLLSYGGQVALAFFCADGGGHTESAQEVFGLNAPYCPAKREAHDIAQAKSVWSKSLRLAEAEARLRALLPPGARLSGAVVAAGELTASGRARAVTAQLAGGAEARIPAGDFRKALGLKSTLFSLTARNDELHVEGRGSGHGVGMSQVGAKELARQLGWDHRRILAFYYEGTRLCAVGGARGGLPRCGASGTAATEYDRRGWLRADLR